MSRETNHTFEIVENAEKMLIYAKLKQPIFLFEPFLTSYSAL